MLRNRLNDDGKRSLFATGRRCWAEAPSTEGAVIMSLLQVAEPMATRAAAFQTFGDRPRPSVAPRIFYR